MQGAAALMLPSSQSDAATRTHSERVRKREQSFQCILHEVPWSAVRARTALCHAAGYGQESEAARFLL